MLLFAVLLLAITFPEVHATVISVSRHVFAKGIDKSQNHWQPVNATDTFTQEDNYVYAFTMGSWSKTNFTWIWHDPSGSIYRTFSDVFDEGSSSEFYARIAIRGADAAAKLGTWRMDLLGDGKMVYSDTFNLVSYVVEEDSWTFDVNAPMHAKVNFTITIHPYNEEWKDYSINIDQDAHASNFAAFEYGTNKALRVSQSTGNSTIKVRVVFDTPKADGYKFIISFDVGAGTEFGTIGANTFLNWNWNTNEANPRPINVTVILPASFTLVSVEGASGYQSSTIADRAIVSFSGTAPPNGAFSWTVTYAALAKSTTSIAPTTQSTSTSGVESVNLLFIVAAIIVGAGVVIAMVFFRRKRGQ